MILGLVLSGCAPTQPARVPTNQVPAAVERPPASPALDTAIAIHGRADGQAIVTAAQVKTLSGQLKQVHDEALSTVAELDRLRAAKFAVESDLVAFYNKLVAQEKLVKTMTLQVTEVEASLAAERLLREQAATKLQETDRLLRDKEAEAQLLRSQLGQANRNSADAEQAVKTTGEALGKAMARADKLQGESAFKTKLLIGSAVLVLLLLAFILLLIKFRTIFPF